MESNNKKFSDLKKYPIIFLFFGFLIIFSLADILVPDQASSDLENRALAQAPALTLSSILDNSWSSSYDNYLQDQLLFRDQLITTYSVLESAQGKLDNNGIWYANNDYQIAENSFLSASQKQKLPLNTAAVAELAARHPGQVNVMIVPSPANVLSDYLRYDPPQIDENALLDEIFATVSDSGANVIDVRNSFAENKDNYLYYRTDHHWTTTGGAWLAYQAFCESIGLEATQPSAPQIELSNFLGTNYAKTKHFSSKADTLTYYDFPNALTIYQPSADGGYTPTETTIMDSEKFDSFDKYGAFLHGNNGYSVIDGNGTGSILVIKDSFGNSFSPYLIENYEKIGIIDLRSWLSVDSTFEEGGYDEILVLYSFEPFSQDMYATRMGDALQR